MYNVFNISNIFVLYTTGANKILPNFWSTKNNEGISTFLERFLDYLIKV